MTYERRASPLHAARAVASGLWVLAIAGCALSFEHPLVLGVLLVVVGLASVFAGIGPRFFGALRFALPFALFIALVNALVVREGLTVVARLGELPPFGQIDVTLEATAYGAVLGLRAVVVLLAFAVATAAIDPDEVLRLFRRVSFRSALTAALAVRLVPVLGRDGRRLAEAARCRAEPAGRAAVLRAVATGALDRAADVAATLELRGYGGPAARVAGQRRPWSRHDVAFVASALALVALAGVAHAGGIGGFDAYPSLEVPTGPGEVALVAAMTLAALLPFADRRGIDP